MVYDTSCIAEENSSHVSGAMLLAGAVSACASEAVQHAATDFALDAKTVYVAITANGVGLKAAKEMIGKQKGKAVLILPGLTKGYVDKKAAQDSLSGEKVVFEVAVSSGAVDLKKYLLDGEKLP